MNKRAPIYRTCIASRNKFLKKDLFRIVKTKSGNIVFDEKQIKEGRGVYLKKDLKAITLAHDRHLLNKVLRAEVSDDIYAELVVALSKEKRD